MRAATRERMDGPKSKDWGQSLVERRVVMFGKGQNWDVWGKEELLDGDAQGREYEKWAPLLAPLA